MGNLILAFGLPSYVSFLWLVVEHKWLGSGCGSVGRVVARDTRGPRFHSSHQQNFIEHLLIINCIEKTKINKKRLGMAHFLKKNQILEGSNDRAYFTA